MHIGHFFHFLPSNFYAVLFETLQTTKIFQLFNRPKFVMQVSFLAERVGILLCVTFEHTCTTTKTMLYIQKSGQKQK